MDTVKQVDIVRALMPLLGKNNFKALRVNVNRVVNGRYKLPKLWETHFLAITGCQSREELRIKYPKIVFHDEKVITSPKHISHTTYEFELVFKVAMGTISGQELNKLMDTVKILQNYGIQAEVHVRHK